MPTPLESYVQPSARVVGDGADAPMFAGTGWLLATDDVVWADGVAHALRGHGACVHLVDAAGHGIERLAAVDAHIVLTILPPTASLRAALDAHPGLRWATCRMVDAQLLWPAEEAPDTAALAQLAFQCCQPDREVAGQAQGERNQFVTPFAPLGPARLLRALDRASDVFVVQFTHGALRAHVALAHGLWLGASCEALGPGHERLEGTAALGRVLELRDAGCLVLRGGRLSARTENQSLAEAIEAGLRALERARAPRESGWGSAPKRLDAPGVWSALSELTTDPRASLRKLSGVFAVPSSTPPAPRPSSLRLPAWCTRRRLQRGAIALGLSVATFGLLTLQATGDPDAVSGPAESLTLTETPPAVPRTHVEPLVEDMSDGPAQTSAALKASPMDEPTQQADNVPSTHAELAPGGWVRSRALSRRARRTRDPVRAHRLWERALHADPNNPHALAALARVQLRGGNGEAALALVQRAVQLRPERSAYRMLLGDVYWSGGQALDAQQAYRAALRSRPGWREARHKLRRAAHAAAPPVP